MGRYRSRSPIRGKRNDEPPPHRRRSVRDHRRSPGPTGLLVRNISLSSRAEDLRVPFERYGPVKDVYLPKNYYTGEPRGFGFVKFRFSEDAAEAKHELDHTVIGGREIRVVFAEENRKTPHEMRRMSRVSSRESYGRRSRSRSPRRRRSSYSPSPSPPRRGSRNERGRDDHHSPRRSRSVSPSNERKYRSKQRSPRRSRSISEPLSPLEERNLKSSKRVRDNTPVDEDYVRDRSQSPRQRNSRSPSRSRSQSYSSR